MQLTPDKKDSFERTILLFIADNLEKGLIKNDELPEIAKFYGDKIDAAQQEEELQAIIPQLTQKWPIFSQFHNQPAVQQLPQSDEQKTLQDVMSLANDGKLEEAVNLAKSVTEPKEQ